MTRDLSPSEKQQLARVLYRSAMWVSISDGDGGRQSQSLEERMLKKRLQYLYKRQKVGTLEREVLGIALANTSSWRVWNEDLSELMGELNVLQSLMSAEIKTMIMEIGKDIAVAFRERSFFAALFAQIGMLIRRCFTKLNPNLSLSEYASISVSERAALMELADALKITDYNI